MIYPLHKTNHIFRGSELSPKFNQGMDFYHENFFHAMQVSDAHFVLEGGLKTIIPTQ